MAGLTREARVGKDKLLVEVVGSTRAVEVDLVVLVVEAISLTSLLVGLSQSITDGSFVPSFDTLVVASSERMFELLSGLAGSVGVSSKSCWNFREFCGSGLLGTKLLKL